MRFAAIGRRRAAFAVVVAGMLATVVAAPTSSGAPARPVRSAQEESSAELKGEWDEVLGEESTLLARVEKARAEQARLTAELDALEAQVHAKETELVATQMALQEAQEQAARQAAALRSAERKVARAKERLRRQIVASYVTGGENSGMLEALLSAEDSDDAGRAIAYSKAIVGDTDVLVKALARAREERKAIDRKAKRTARTARARRDDVRDATAYLAGARDNQRDLVDQVNVEIFNEATALRAVQGKKALIEGRINAEMTTSDGVAMILADRQKDQPDWVPGDVEITTPIPGYRIGSAFGPRLHPILGIVRLHAGGDIGAPSGHPIYAPADGVVVLAEVRGGYGNTTVIDHGHSLGTLYGHQSRIAVKPGQVVKRGDLIGYVGSTGLSTGPHLHFETRVRGMPINPEGVVDWEAEVDYG
ncbi:MAG: peptidoglycan DD-metalloendopeptidase family protein [Actinobacteria bacterium]|nr:peptidoglycan DD-metalloendopeptidase family protein [Actinomycetota bacterium]